MHKTTQTSNPKIVTYIHTIVVVFSPSESSRSGSIPHPRISSVSGIASEYRPFCWLNISSKSWFGDAAPPSMVAAMELGCIDGARARSGEEASIIRWVLGFCLNSELVDC